MTCIIALHLVDWFFLTYYNKTFFKKGKSWWNGFPFLLMAHHSTLPMGLMCDAYAHKNFVGDNLSHICYIILVYWGPWVTSKSFCPRIN